MNRPTAALSVPRRVSPQFSLPLSWLRSRLRAALPAVALLLAPSPAGAQAVWAQAAAPAPTVSPSNLSPTVIQAPALQNLLVGGLTVFPPVAAPGETAWLYVSSQSARVPQSVWVGGSEARVSRDRAPGWYAFQVPRDAAPGPQAVGLGEPARGGGLVLTVLPAADVRQGLALYLRAAPDGQEFPAEVQRRLREFAARCDGRCPAELQKTAQAMIRLPLRPFGPLGRPAGARLAPVQAAELRQALPQLPVFGEQAARALGLSDLLTPGADVAFAAQGGLCGLFGGLLDTQGLPSGQVMGLLSLLFPGELGVDPSVSSHPASALRVFPAPGSSGSAPYSNQSPVAVLGQLSGGWQPRSGGAGVVIHVLDTAAGASSDPFLLSGANYYNTTYNRPGHGSVVGALAGMVAPAAKLDYQQVCDGNGDCQTLRVAQAMCAVAAQARAGGRHVLNLSAGGPYPALGLFLVGRELAALNVPTVAAYGNRDDCPDPEQVKTGARCWHYPADWTGLFTQAAAPTTLLYSVAGWDIATKQRATYNRPAPLSLAPSVLAPGEFWVSGMPYFGSSFAAPIVSGLLADWMGCKPGQPLLPLVTATGSFPLPAGLLNACP